MSEVITDPILREFVHSKVNKTFDLAIDTIAVKCKNYGRFKSWLNSDVNRIKKVLTIVRDNGVSPAFFASYEKTEGYNSKWGWLNHTKIKGSPEEDAKETAKWIVYQSNNTTDKPAWIDYANYNDFVPSSVKQAGNADFENMSVGSIGKVVIAGTAAATWEVYYPDGLKKEYNGVQDYAKPINIMKDTIIEWGGNIEGDNPNPDPDPNPNPDPDPIDPPEYDFGIIDDTVINMTNGLISAIEQMLTIRLFDYGTSNTFGNDFVTAERIYNNYYKLKTNNRFKDIVEEIVRTGKANLDDVIESINPERPPDEEVIPEEPNPNPDPPPDDDEMYFPVDYTGNGINFWHPPHAKGSTQEGMEFGGPRDGGRIHAGYDIGARGIKGHKVYAVRSGRVISVGNEGNAGFVIRIKHSTDNKYTRYMHLVVNSNTVKEGDNVKAGQQIGIMGDTPNGMYKIHLHIEVDTTGEFRGYDYNENPRVYLQVTGNNKTNLPNPAKK